MAEDGQLARFSARPGPTDPSLVELLDPHALEERLKDARSRRAEALARRNAAETDPHTQQSVGPPPRLVVAPAPAAAPEPTAAVVPALPAAEAASWRLQTGAYLALIFVAGLGLGGAAVAVLALRSLPDRIAALPEPAAPVTAPAPTAPAATAPQTAPAPAAVPPHTVAAPPQAPAVAMAEAGDEPAPPPVTLSFSSPAPAGLAEPASEAAPQISTATASLPAPAAPEPPAPPPVASLPAPATPTPVAAQPASPAPAPVASQPAPPPAAALPAEPTAAPASPAAPETTAALPTPETTSALPPQVIIHYPASAESAAIGIRDALESEGGVSVQIVPVRFAIGRSNIRYYHASDAEGAAALSGFVAPALPAEAPPEPRDFTDYATPTASGKVEIWLAGTPPNGVSAAPYRSARRAVTPAADTPDAPAVAPRLYPDASGPATQSQAEAVERILIERLKQ